MTAWCLALGCLVVSCANDDPRVVSSQHSGSGGALPGTDPTAGAPTTTSPSGSTSTSSVRPAGTAGTIEWQPVSKGLERGTLAVPRDYRDPSGGTFVLSLERHLARRPDQRIGSLLVNRGGPGFGSADLAEQAEQIYGAGILDRFDIVGWDPRGTGQSEPHIDCTDDYDHFFASGDITPDTDAERQQLVDTAKEFADLCVSRDAAFYQYVGTNDSARDMDAIRRALGEGTISYFGFSYGSELGATWATLFPTTVRAAVLDGAADPNAGQLEGDLQQARGFESTLTTFLAQCSADERCAFSNGGDSEGAFVSLMASLDEHPIPTAAGRPDLTRGMALTAVADAMYSQGSWAQLEQALADARRGDGGGLLQLYDDYYQRRPDGTYDDSLEAFQVISCMDDPTRLTVAEEDALVPRFQAAAPRFAAGTTGDYFCTFFPPSKDPRVRITGTGAGPIVVIGTTGDPATPIESSRNMAKALEGGRFIEVVADQHTGYNVNRCVDDAVDSYLTDLKIPADNLRCG